MNQIAVLPKDHINYRPFINFFRERICDTKTRDVYCCNDDWPKDTEVKNLKDCDSKKVNVHFFFIIIFFHIFLFLLILLNIT